MSHLSITLAQYGRIQKHQDASGTSRGRRLQQMDRGAQLSVHSFAPAQA